jgi:hypothetical protein
LSNKEKSIFNGIIMKEMKMTIPAEGVEQLPAVADTLVWPGRWE